MTVTPCFLRGLPVEVHV